MKRIFCCILLMCLILCSCESAGIRDEGDHGDQNNQQENSTDPNPSDDTVLVNGKSFSVDEINEGIKNTFNNVLYYYGNDEKSNYLTFNQKIALKKELNYELYFEPNGNTGSKAFVFSPKIYLVITNIAYPFPDQGANQLYVFGIDLTEWGLRSDFSYQGFCALGETNPLGDKNTIYLGNHSMRIDSVIPPDYEIMDDNWKENVKKAIRLYMEMDAEKQNESFLPGNYRIYVQSFFKSDKDSRIIFVNGNGDIYTGRYYFIHDVPESAPADINNLSLEKSDDQPSIQAYLDLVCASPAVAMEYTVAP